MSQRAKDALCVGPAREMYLKDAAETAATLEDLFRSRSFGVYKSNRIEAEAEVAWVRLVLSRPSAFAESGCHRLGLHAVRTSRYRCTHIHSYSVGSHPNGCVPVLFINSLAVNSFLF